MKILLIVFMLFSFSLSDTTIEVIKKVDSLPSITVEDLSETNDKVFRTKVLKSIVADLNVLSIFNVKNAGDESEGTSEYFVKFKIVQSDSKQTRIEYFLFKDNINVLRKIYKVKQKNRYMFIAHSIAYDINKFMGQPPVDWMKKKIIFSKRVSGKTHKIVISDYTLSYQHTIINKGFNLFPKWANEKQTEFYFTSLDSNIPVLKHVNIETGKTVSILSSDGMIVCSDVSDNYKKILVTMAKTGQPDIYLYNVASKRVQRLTRFRGIDVNGQFMGDNKISFVSNRLGYPNIFFKDMSSSTISQLVYYGKDNSACSASSDYVVYKARESSEHFSKNTFNLHLVSLKTDYIRRLTATGVNEFPRFSKDGNVIMFIKHMKSQSSLGILRLKHNKSYLFPLKVGKIQAIDW